MLSPAPLFTERPNWLWLRLAIARDELAECAGTSLGASVLGQEFVRLCGLRRVVDTKSFDGGKNVIG